MGITQRTGDAGERLAAAYLELAGCTVLEHNRRIAGVEVDLVAAEGATRVLVEVKYRSRADWGGAAAAVDHAKRERLRRAARALQQQGVGRVRIDVVGVELTEDGAVVRHHRNAVWDGGG